jgi:La-related protein 7
MTTKSPVVVNKDEEDDSSESKILKLSTAASGGGDFGRKKPRKRMKSIYKTIVDQMDFYLGDANLSRSVFLKEKISTALCATFDTWIDLDIFLTFNKLAGILREYFGQAETTDDLYHALNSISSDIFEVRQVAETGLRQVKRRKAMPTQNREVEEARTLYVERLSPNVDIDTLKQVFDKFGPVNYISLPKFRHNGLPKGFAFVEFRSEDGLNKTLEAYVEAKRRIASTVDPSELQSIKSYHIEQEQLKKVPTEKKKTEDPEVVEVKAVTEGGGDGDGGNGGGEAKKAKRKRKRKHKDSDQITANKTADPEALLMLQIMPRSEWKRLRNKYLDLQRKNMANSKMKMRQFFEPEEGSSTVQEEEADLNKKPPLEFTKGVIVKFIQDEPIEDEKKVKQRIKAAVMETVNYVDAKIGAKEYFVRCANPEQAKTLANAKILGNSEILSGQGEEEYWEKIMKDREAKVSGKVKVPNAGKKQRGKLRIIKKFEKSIQQHENSHCYFNDNNEEVVVE